MAYPTLAEIVQSLLAGAEPVSATATLAQRKVDMVEAWRDAIPYLEFRQRVSSLEWLSSYFIDCYQKWETVSPRGLSAELIGSGSPSSDFQASINKVTAVAIRLGILEKKQPLPKACVLPLATPNPLILLLGDGAGGTTRFIAYQLGLREFIRGMATILLTIEESLPRDLFSNKSPPSPDVWLQLHREAVNARLEEESLFTYAAQALLAQTLLGGRSLALHRLLPLASTTQPLRRMLCEHADYFMVGHEIAGQMTNQKAESPSVEAKTMIGPIEATALVPGAEEETFANVMGFTLADNCLEPRFKAAAPVLRSFPLAGPDFHLTCLDCLERAVSTLGGCRAKADRRLPARDRRELRRVMLRAWDSKPTLVLGQRLEIMMEALLERSLQFLSDAVDRGMSLSYIWTEGAYQNLKEGENEASILSGSEGRSGFHGQDQRDP